MSVLTLENLAVCRGKKRILSDISLRLEASESLALMGQNGSGKTSLLEGLMGLVPLESGRVTFLGQACAPGARLLRTHLGAVFQHPSVDAKLTVQENLSLGARLMGLRGQDARRAVATMCLAFGLEERLGMPCGQLSGGLRRRVELARALLHRPRLLILDEPSFGLDPQARSGLWDILNARIKEDGLSILTSTHDPQEASRHTRVALLAHGHLVALDSPDALLAHVSEDVVVLEGDNAAHIEEVVTQMLGTVSERHDAAVWVRVKEGHTWVPKLVAAIGPAHLRSVSLRRANLADVLSHFSAQASKMSLTEHA